MKSKSTFNNLARLRGIVSDLPTAHTEELYRQSVGRRVENIGTYKAVVKDADTPEPDVGDFVTIVGEDYNLIQHKEAFKPALDILKQMDPKCSGTVETYNGDAAVIINVSSPNLGFEIDGDSQYNCGFRMYNSFDKSSALRMKAYAERLVCANGMVIESAVIEPFYRKHIGDNMQEEIAEWIEKLRENVPDLKDRILSISDQKYQAFEALRAIGMPETHAELIAEGVSGGEQKEVSRKELYDRTTQYITHEKEPGSLSTQDRYWRLSERLLFGNLSHAIERYRKQKAAAK